tara:strand:+ start:389 stop:646 length:258 start_codon:yes stop_codon:yes gene_type:complete
MISWSPSCQALRHINVGSIKIPLGNLFKGFKIDTINLSDDTLVISLLEKNHYLLECPINYPSTEQTKELSLIPTPTTTSLKVQLR